MAELEPTRTRDWARILSVTQAVAIALALIMDAVIVTLHWHVMRHPPRHNWRPPVYSALVAIGALCALLPPGKGRLGRLPLAISLLALPLVGFVKPTLGIAGVMLAAIVVLRCTLVLGVRGGAVALAFALGECAIGVGEQFWFLHLEKRFPQGLRFTYLLAGLIGSLLLFGVGGGLMIAIVSLLRSERNARGELQEAHQQLQAYAVQAAHTAALEERARIALDVHDALGHGLTTLSVQLQSAARLRAQDAQKADAYVERAMATASLLLEDVRETVSVLRRDPDGAECFSDRARKLFTDFSQMDLLECTWHVALEQEPNGPIGIALFRILQEALTNVARHADAKHLTASVDGDEQQITMTITDDGCGFNEAEAGTGNGLASMRERLSFIGGRLTVDTQSARGTTIFASVPVTTG